MHFNNVKDGDFKITIPDYFVAESVCNPHSNCEARPSKIS